MDSDDEVVFLDVVPVSSSASSSSASVSGSIRQGETARRSSSLDHDKSETKVSTVNRTLTTASRSLSIPLTKKVTTTRKSTGNMNANTRWTCPECDVEVTDSAKCDFCGTENVPPSLKPAANQIIDDTSDPKKVSRNGVKQKRPSTKATIITGDDDEESDLFQDNVFTTTTLKRPAMKSSLTSVAVSQSLLTKKPRIEIETDHAEENTPWTTKYAPKSIEDLKRIVDTKRVEWVHESLLAAVTGSGPRLIVLHGPTGAGKSSTVKVVANELGMRIRDWEEESSASATQRSTEEFVKSDFSVPYQRQVDTFSKFLSDCCYPSLSLTSKRSGSAIGDDRNGTVVLLESLPRSKSSTSSNGPQSVEEAQERLFQHVDRLSRSPHIRACIVYVLTVDGASKASDSQIKEAIGDMNACVARSIGFNPVPRTRLMATLKAVVMAEGMTLVAEKELAALDDGDLRAAINNLQFLSITSSKLPQKSAGSKKKRKVNETASLTTTSISTKDQSFALCYAVGKLIRGPKPDGIPFQPETVARNCALEPPALAAFIHENFYKYASANNCDVRAYSALMDHLAFADCIMGGKWSALDRSLESGGGEDMEAADALAESILARGACCWQPFATEGIGGNPKGLIEVVKPQMFEAQREAQRITNETREYLRARSDCSSASMFVKDVLPFSSLITTSHDGVARSRMMFSQLSMRNLGPGHDQRRMLDEDEIFGDVSLLMEEEIEEDEA